MSIVYLAEKYTVCNKSIFRRPEYWFSRFGRHNGAKKGEVKQILMIIPYTFIKTCVSEPPPSFSIVKNVTCMLFPSAMMSNIVSMCYVGFVSLQGDAQLIFSLSS